jgi:RNA polymerase sigma-70 factor, ECF subfamily
VGDWTDKQKEDLDLLSRAAGGSEEAFLDLFRRWAPSMRRFLVRSTGSVEAGEDLLQEAWIRILRAAPRYEPRAPVGAWIFRIATHLTYGYWRGEQRARRRMPAADPEAVLRTPAPGAGPERQRWRKAFAEAVERAAADLPPPQRLVFLLKAEQGWTYEEIAAVLSCPVGTVKSRLHHALLALRRDLSEWQESDGPGVERSQRSAAGAPGPWPAASGAESAAPPRPLDPARG